MSKFDAGNNYQCPDCGPFHVPNNVDYDSDPSTRKCPICKGHQGKIMYLGYAGSLGYIQTDSIGDGIKGVMCPVNGKTYDSKSEYYRVVKEAGCEILGNDVPPPSKPKVKEIDWKQAVSENYDKMISSSPKKRKGKK